MELERGSTAKKRALQLDPSVLAPKSTEIGEKESAPDSSASKRRKQENSRNDAEERDRTDLEDRESSADEEKGREMEEVADFANSESAAARLAVLPATTRLPLSTALLSLRLLEAQRHPYALHINDDSRPWHYFDSAFAVARRTLDAFWEKQFSWATEVTVIQNLRKLFAAMKSMLQHLHVPFISSFSDLTEACVRVQESVAKAEEEWATAHGPAVEAAKKSRLLKREDLVSQQIPKASSVALQALVVAALKVLQAFLENVVARHINANSGFNKDSEVLIRIICEGCARMDLECVWKEKESPTQTDYHVYSAFDARLEDDEPEHEDCRKSALTTYRSMSADLIDRLLASHGLLACTASSVACPSLPLEVSSLILDYWREPSFLIFFQVENEHNDAGVIEIGDHSGNSPLLVHGEVELREAAEDYWKLLLKILPKGKKRYPDFCAGDTSDEDDEEGGGEMEAADEDQKIAEGKRSRPMSAVDLSTLSLSSVVRHVMRRSTSIECCGFSAHFRYPFSSSIVGQPQRLCNPLPLWTAVLRIDELGSTKSVPYRQMVDAGRVPWTVLLDKVVDEH